MKRSVWGLGIASLLAMTGSLVPGSFGWGEAASWKLLPAPSPGFQLPSYAYDTNRRRGVLFGGYGESCLDSCAPGYSQDTWEWDGTAWTKIAVSGLIPSPRDSAAAAFGAAWGKVVMQGGFNNDVYTSDTWTYDGTSWNLVSTNGPQRSDQAAAYDSRRQRVILFGGSVVWHGAYNETWAWDGSQWTLVSNTGPSPRMYAAMAYDATRDRMVLFGGQPAWNNPSYAGDTWEWDGSSWTQAATTGPNGRSASLMVYDPVRQRVVLFGGYTGGASNYSDRVYYDDTWEWDGVQWTKVHISGPSPSPRHGGAAFYDVNRGSIILVGGYGGPNFGYGDFHHDTWEYRPTDEPSANCLGAGASLLAGGVKTAEGSPIPGVTMILAGPGDCSDTRTSTGLGLYWFPKLAPGTYSVLPQKAGCIFDPPSQTRQITSRIAWSKFTGTCPE
jgi:hypothetical protein